MTLLDEVMRHPLDPGYVAAAERRHTIGDSPRGHRRVAAMTAAAVFIGFGFTVSALALRPVPTAATKAKATLIERIESLRTHDDRAASGIATAEAEIARYQQAALGQSGNAAIQEQLERLSAASGAVPLRGAGVVITLDDAVEADTDNVPGRGGGQFSDGRVTAKDLQIIINGLWQSGAEAIAINGQRLTSRAAIRFAGRAILVDYRPLSRPYVVTALGDSSSLQTELAATLAGGYLKALVDNYAIRADLVAATDLAVPAAASLKLQVARVPRPDSSPKE
jgi:uncharacterized protein YlxW (UPF0749 family)